MTNIILSFLALFAGIVSLFTDVEKPKGKAFAGVLGLILFATFGVQIYQHNQAEKEVKDQKENIESLTKIVSDLSIFIREFRAETQGSFVELSELRALNTSFGSVENNPNIDTIQKHIEADEARTQLLQSTNSTQRNQITFQYFPKVLDKVANKDIVESSIKELGFKFTLGEPGIPDVPTNALFYGDDVSIDDVKLVALTLIRAGIEIKHIRQFRSSTGRESLIQIGSGTAYISKPPYSVEAIQQATSFPL